MGTCQWGEIGQERYRDHNEKLSAKYDLKRRHGLWIFCLEKAAEKRGIKGLFGLPDPERQKQIDRITDEDRDTKIMWKDYSEAKATYDQEMFQQYRTDPIHLERTAGEAIIKGDGSFVLPGGVYKNMKDVKSELQKDKNGDHLIPEEGIVAKVELTKYFYKSLPKEIHWMTKETYQLPDISLLVHEGKIIGVKMNEITSSRISLGKDVLNKFIGLPLNAANLAKVTGTLQEAVMYSANESVDEENYLEQVCLGTGLSFESEKKMLTYYGIERIASPEYKKMMKKMNIAGWAEVSLMPDGRTINEIKIHLYDPKKVEREEEATVAEIVSDVHKGKEMKPETAQDIVKYISTALPNMLEDIAEERKNK